MVMGTGRWRKVMPQQDRQSISLQLTAIRTRMKVTGRLPDPNMRMRSRSRVRRPISIRAGFSN
ncbi:uncharacterized protein PGTG_21764 [Puccinia graminis f. sp. tritici CRL 75-36-700-3]|uniref:Uncharacterized protein n=1 Tax=Puccinia graminis f. sp. tritici (strain CRL 75-36-700-3 / race SCCL) TaxID=418459 RepID=H6QSE8_PUCGT|nr:uncharacterized protein PGTG_21764 [Puccinia graminis f. sp. tritici CRL 75-36-700-3]EHS63678.1 hypothetical protein PGTG_21764 [Puccinia graminis f. sp. tritici CRL 75-36-700-3]